MNGEQQDTRKNVEKAGASTATQMETKEHQETATAAQNAQGASSMGTQSAAAMATSSRAAVNINLDNDQATNVARFQNALTQCADQFRGLGGWLAIQIENAAEIVGIPVLFQKFSELPIYLKVLVMILILGLVWLLRTLVWDGVSYIWPHIMNFINSSYGQSFLSTATSWLEGLSSSGIFARFTQMFSTAVNEQSQDADAEPACLSLNDWTTLASTSAFPIIELISLFFNYMSENMNNNK